MLTEDNKAALRRFTEEVWNQGRVAVLDELCAPDFILHEPTPPDGLTREDLKRWVTACRNAFTDFHFTSEDMIAEAEQVVIRWTMKGTHTGDFVSPLKRISATGKHVTMPGIFIFRVASGKFVEGWHYQDSLGMLQQLGMLPAPQPVGP